MILTLTPDYKDKNTGHYTKVALFFGDSDIPATLIDIEELYQEKTAYMSLSDIYGRLSAGQEVVVRLEVKEE